MDGHVTTAGTLAAFIGLVIKQVFFLLFPSGKTVHTGCGIFHLMDRTSLSKNDANTEKVELKDEERSCDDI